MGSRLPDRGSFSSTFVGIIPRGFDASLGLCKQASFDLFAFTKDLAVSSHAFVNLIKVATDQPGETWSLPARWPPVPPVARSSHTLNVPSWLPHRPSFPGSS